MAGLSTIELGVVGVVVLLVLLLAWRFLRRPTVRVRAETVDVLTPGAAPAARNTRRDRRGDPSRRGNPRASDIGCG
jgi:hypothetical protein